MRRIITLAIFSFLTYYSYSQTTSYNTHKHLVHNHYIKHTTVIHYYKNHNGQTIQSPTYYDKAPEGATAMCADRTYSFSASHRGTCSHHGGVRKWL